MALCHMQTLLFGGYLLSSLVLYLRLCNHSQCVKNFHADCYNQSVIAFAFVLINVPVSYKQNAEEHVSSKKIAAPGEALSTV
jgi:hypothetical protein